MRWLVVYGLMVVAFGLGVWAIVVQNKILIGCLLLLVGIMLFVSDWMNRMS